jgi:hypothetical protein
MQALHRSRGFWFGFAGLVMLCGMWVHSSRWKMVGELRQKDHSAIGMMSHSRGRVGFATTWNRDIDMTRAWELDGSCHELEPGQKLSMVPGPLLAWEASEPTPPAPDDPFFAGGSGGYYFRGRLPHWLLLLLYLLAWAAVHGCMWRRRKRAMPALEPS